MNSRLILNNIIKFLIIMLLQVLIFNYLNIFGYINPYIYLYFVLLLPFETPIWLLIIIAFITGFTQDNFLNTGGIHAAATTFIAFIRPILLGSIYSKREYENNLKPSVADIGWTWFLSFMGISILIHSLMVSFIDVFKFSQWSIILKHSFFQAFATLFFIVLIEMIANLGRKK